MTDDLFARLNKAEEMSFENWRIYRTLYNTELGKLNDRIEALKEALREIVNMDTDPEFGTPPLASAQKIARAALGEKKDGA